MKETKDKLFIDWKDVEGFVGAGLAEDHIQMYWEDEIPENAPNDSNGYRIEHTITGKITLQ